VATSPCEVANSEAGVRRFGEEAMAKACGVVMAMLPG